MNPEIEQQRSEYQTYMRELRDLLTQEGRDPTPSEMARGREMRQALEAAEAAASDRDAFAAEMEAATRAAVRVQAQSAETRARIGEAAGRDVASSARQRDAFEMHELRRIGVDRDRNAPLTLDYGAARNARELARIGVTPEDIGQALRHGEALRVERSPESGQPDARAYNITSDATSGATTVPTITATMLYDEMEFVGGVRASGAEVYPALPLTQTEFPQVTAHGTGSTKRTETQDGAESDDTLGETVLTPQPYRGLAIVSQAMLTSNVVGFAGYLARALGRLVGRSMEDDFHNGDAISGQKQGIIAGAPPAGRRIDTADGSGGDDMPTVAHWAAALGLLDAGYHGAGDAVSMMNDAGSPGRGVRWLMSSQFFFNGIVGATATDGHFLYPRAAETGTHFGRRVGFSSFMAGAAAGDAQVAIAGNFYDGYLIAEDGLVQVTFDTSVEFKSSQVVYKGECHAQGSVRDPKALAWIRTTNA